MEWPISFICHHLSQSAPGSKEVPLYVLVPKLVRYSFLIYLLPSTICVQQINPTTHSLTIFAYCQVSWYDLPSSCLPTSGCLQLHLPPLHSNSKAYLCNLCNYVAPTLRLTADQYWTCLDLVPTPRATIYIPFPHLSYLPDPFSFTIVGNYSFLV